jgi:hypothetical protein
MRVNASLNGVQTVCCEPLSHNTLLLLLLLLLLLVVVVVVVVVVAVVHRLTFQWPTPLRLQLFDYWHRGFESY